ncbi:unnamed protein product, partial [marine sediment metagenome]
LLQTLQARGYTFRQHLEEEGWGMRKPTVVDLSDAQRKALAQGGIATLKDTLDSEDKYSFPAFDITDPLAVTPDVVLSRDGRPAALVVAPASEPDLWKLAEDIVDKIATRHGVKLSLVDDREAAPDLLAAQHLVVVGGSHRNRLALALALRHQTFFLDAGVPGEDGWTVTTHCGLHASGHNVVQIAASGASRAAALQCLLDAVSVESHGPILRHTHRIEPGRIMKAHFPSWEAFTAGLPRLLPQLQG